MKSSTQTWHLLHNVKSTVKISSIFVAFLGNMNFNINQSMPTAGFSDLPTALWVSKTGRVFYVFYTAVLPWRRPMSERIYMGPSI